MAVALLVLVIVIVSSKQGAQRGQLTSQRHAALSGQNRAKI